MTGYAARSLGYDVHVLDPDPDCPARAIASRVITARFDDADAAAQLASRCAVVSLEIEQIGGAALEAAERFCPVRPGPEVVRIIQDRIRQKVWLASHGFPLGPHRIVESEAQLADAVRALGASIAKAPTGGYDGRGQVRLSTPEEAPAAWKALGERACVVEQFLDIDLELSVLIARQGDGSHVAYPPAHNHHEHGILDWSVLPGPFSPALVSHATQVAHAIAETLQLEGLLAVELFLVRDGRLFVNELAPRPHNTYHASERASLTSQFEQLVRAVCHLPLGAADVVRPGAIANLLGDLWRGDAAPPWERALAIPGVRLHLYGKASARPGRKMGHLSSIAETGDEARRLVLDARTRLTSD
jgi:5-(carboxyamino)imidazole ribonucleotide synthase